MTRARMEHQRAALSAALRNEGVRIDHRPLVGGSGLRGIYAVRDFAAGEYVASYHGKVISREALMARAPSDMAFFEMVNEYSFATPDGTGHLYPEDVDALGAHLINHSCGPNTARAGFHQQGALLFRCVRPIMQGEELTIHYGWVGMKAARERTQHLCLCDAPFCVGTVELGLEWIEHDDRSGGLYLPPDEVFRRFFADIVNDTDRHEALVHDYRTKPGTLAPGMKFTSFDDAAFYDRCQESARRALALAQAIQGADAIRTGEWPAPSESRLRHFTRAYRIRDDEVGPVREALLRAMPANMIVARLRQGMLAHRKKLGAIVDGGDGVSEGGDDA